MKHRWRSIFNNNQVVDKCAGCGAIKQNASRSERRECIDEEGFEYFEFDSTPIQEAVLNGHSVSLTKCKPMHK